MPGSSRKAPVWLPILVLLIAMSSIQSGASLAKSLFPLVGAPGVTALRLALGTLILIAFFKPWRLRFAKEQRLPLLHRITDLDQQGRSQAGELFAK